AWFLNDSSELDKARKAIERISKRHTEKWWASFRHAVSAALYIRDGSIEKAKRLLPKIETGPMDNKVIVIVLQELIDHNELHSVHKFIKDYLAAGLPIDYKEEWLKWIKLLEQGKRPHIDIG